MNKLVTVFSALAVAAGIAQGEVKSANIVGFIEYTGAKGSLLWTVPTFKAVGTDGSAATVAEIGANDTFVGGGDVIRIFGTDGKQKYELSYLNATEAEAEGAEVGWYTLDAWGDWDFSETYRMNDLALPYGTGLVFVPTTEGATITYSGEVHQADKPITASKGALLWTGNTSPVDIKISQLRANDTFVGGGDVIRIFGTDGKQKYELSYLNATEAEAEGAEVGWYTLDAWGDWDFSETYRMNDIDLRAGEGFVFVPATEGAAIVVKNPIVE